MASRIARPRLSTRIVKAQSVMTDVVSKEMYSFEDAAVNRSLFDPEATAGMVRARLTMA